MVGRTAPDLSLYGIVLCSGADTRNDNGCLLSLLISAISLLHRYWRLLESAVSLAKMRA